MEQLNAKQLSVVNESVRNLIFEYISKNKMSLNQFAKQSGCHQNQLWLYLYSNESKKGLHSSTLQKIGVFLSKNS